MKKVMLLAATAILMSACNNEDTWSPLPPPIPPKPAPEMVSVDLNVRLTENTTTDPAVHFVSKWNEGHRILGYSMKTKEAFDASFKSTTAKTRTSVIDPRRLFYLTDGIGTDLGVVKGLVVKGDDSLVIFRTSMNMLRFNYVKRQYRTDSVPEVFRYDDLMVGTAKIDTVNGTVITMKHATSILDIKLVNKTGLDLQIRKVTVRPADVNCWPFHTSMDECIYIYYGGIDAGSANTLVAEYSKGYVAKEATFTVRHSLFLINDSILDGKALIYSVMTDSGIYSYTKVGKKYEGGMRHVEEIVMEGQ